MGGPYLDRAALVPVMAFMQGPGLILLAPLLVSFFLGGPVLAAALAQAGHVSGWNVGLHGVALATALAGGALASSDVVNARTVGLAFLATVAVAQAWSGLALAHRGDRIATLS